MCNVMCRNLLEELGRYGMCLVLQGQGVVAEGIKHFGGPKIRTCDSPGDFFNQESILRTSKSS